MSRTRREFLVGSGLLVTGGIIVSADIARALAQQAGAPPAGQQAAPPTVPVFTAIRRNVGFFTGRGGTIGYLINAGGVVVVDTQFPDSAKMCLDGLNERSKNRPVDLLINTHHHGDHTGGNIVFKGIAKKVLAQATAAEHMRTPPGRPAPTTENLYPDATFVNTWTETIGDETIQAKYYGHAHTSGDAVITFQRANVAHMGDLMFNRRHPVIDRPAGASLKSWITVVEGAAKDHNADTIYIFGHGGTNQPVTGTRADLMVMRDYLTALLAFVQAEIKAGKTRDAIAAITTPLPKFEINGPLTAAVLGAAYDELTS